MPCRLSFSGVLPTLSLPPFAQQGKPAAAQYPRNTQKSTFPAVFSGNAPVCVGYLAPFSLFSKTLYTAFYPAVLPPSNRSASPFSHFTVIFCFLCTFRTTSALSRHFISTFPAL